MNILLLGAAGFIGTNLIRKLVEDESNKLTLADKSKENFKVINDLNLNNANIAEVSFGENTNFDELLEGQDIVFHLVSTTVPATANQQISQELTANVVVTSLLLEACVRCRVKKVVFISSGGTVYGKETNCPLKENTPTNPISSYGIQKITIEKLLYLYYYMHGLDYRVIRLANPYGPYQQPNGVLGAVTTFTYKALKNEELIVYGDGTVIRDFIYIDDAVLAILKIVKGESKYRIFNLGSGHGTSIKEVLETIQTTLNVPMNVIYKLGRKVDVPVNYLDISRYENAYGKLRLKLLNEGIKETAAFMRVYYKIY